MAIIKQSTFPAMGPSGEPLVRLLTELPSAGDSFEKIASVHPEILAYKSQLSPEPGKTYVHILALGAGEYYGPNLNNDHFPWQGLQHDHTKTPHPHLHGFKTFLNAHAFAHHVNKDPEKAYGDVLLSVLNSQMKRVELIVAIDDEKCVRNGGEKTLQRIKAGEYPSTSMGCRVPYDVCSICGHKARFRPEYCEHMTTQAGKIYEDGRKVFVYNPYPRFFDISFVFIGADRTSFVLERIDSAPKAEKVAYVGQGLVNTVKGLNWTTKGIGKRMAVGAATGAATGAMMGEDGNRVHAMLRGGLLGAAAGGTVGQVANMGAMGTAAMGLTVGGMAAGMNTQPPPPPGMSSTLSQNNPSTSLNFQKTALSADAALRKKLRKMTGTVQPYIGIRLSHKVAPTYKNVPTAGKVRDAVRKAIREISARAISPVPVTYINVGAQSQIVDTRLTQATDYVPIQETNADYSAVRGGDMVASNEKVAAQKAAEVSKMSDIFKNVSSLPMGRAVPLLTRTEPDMPTTILDRLAGAPDLGQSLGGLGAAGIVLKPHEFQRVILVRSGQQDLADRLQHAGQVFDYTRAPVERSVRIVIRAPSVGAIPMGLMDMIKTVIERRSALAPLALRRSAEIVATPAVTPVVTPVLSKIAALYNGYREDLLLHAEDLIKTAMDTPAVMRIIETTRGGGYADEGPAMEALSELPMAYFSHAYWNRCCCDRTLSDAAFASKFTEENPHIAKYLATLVATR